MSIGLSSCRIQQHDTLGIGIHPRQHLSVSVPYRRVSNAHKVVTGPDAVRHDYVHVVFACDIGVMRHGFGQSASRFRHAREIDVRAQLCRVFRVVSYKRFVADRGSQRVRSGLEHQLTFTANKEQ